MSATLHEPAAFSSATPAAGSTGMRAPSYRGILGAVRLHFARKRAVYRLDCLSDRALADIGIDRTEIRAVVRRNLRRG